MIAACGFADAKPQAAFGLNSIALTVFLLDEGIGCGVVDDLALLAVEDRAARARAGTAPPGRGSGSWPEPGKNESMEGDSHLTVSRKRNGFRSFAHWHDHAELQPNLAFSVP